jgi:3',5'-cyclic-AMP phosphodiesterase
MTDLEKRKLNRRKFLLGLAGFSMLNLKLPEAQAYKSFQPFSFAFVSDVHLSNDLPDSYELVHESQLFLQQLVKELNTERVDFVMFGGDQVQTIGKNEANWNLFLDCLQLLNAGWSFVLGDRDISGPIPVDKFKTYGRDWQLVGVKGENAYWSQNPKVVPDIHVIGLDTSLPNTTIGGMSHRQLEWLKQDLEANKQNFTIIFCHHPLLPPPPYDGGPPWDEYVIPDGGAVREILGQYPQVKMVISGHVHVSKVQLENNIWHVSSPSLAVYPCAYRIFHVTPEAVTMETRSIEFPALVKKARKELINSSIAERFNAKNPGSFVAVVDGDGIDRNAVIPLRAGQQLKAYNPKRSRRSGEEKAPEPEISNRESAENHPEKPATNQQQPEPPKHRRFGRHQSDAAAAASSGKDKPAGDTDKPVQLEPVKDVDAELNKQLNINSNINNNDGADSQ